MFKRLSLLFAIVTMVAVVACSPLKYGEDAENGEITPEGDISNIDGNGNDDITIDTVTGIYTIDYVNDTCSGPEFSFDDDSLYVKIAEDGTITVDMDDGAYEEVVSYKDNQVTFNVKETEDSEDYVACNITFEGVVAKGMCDLTVGECTLTYIKCTDDVEDTETEMECMKEACKNSMNPEDCPATDDEEVVEVEVEAE